MAPLRARRDGVGARRRRARPGGAAPRAEKSGRSRPAKRLRAATPDAARVVTCSLFALARGWGLGSSCLPVRSRRRLHAVGAGELCADEGPPELGSRAGARGTSESPCGSRALGAGETAVLGPAPPGRACVTEQRFRPKCCRVCGLRRVGLGAWVAVPPQPAVQEPEFGRKHLARGSERTNLWRPLCLRSPKPLPAKRGGKIRFRSSLINFLFNVTGPHCGRGKHVTQAINLRLWRLRPPPPSRARGGLQRAGRGPEPSRSGAAVL